MHNPNPRAMSIFRDMLNIFNLPELPLPHMLNQNILQLTPFITPGEERTILPLLKNVEISRWCNEFADITAKGVSKAKGLKEIAEWGGYPISDTIAFGDGGKRPDHNQSCRHRGCHGKRQPGTQASGRLHHHYRRRQRHLQCPTPFQRNLIRSDIYIWF